MDKKMPRTPFSTPLSGSAGETERRIRSIFSGPKKRPPVPLLALMCAACLLCGNLVSCQEAEAESPDLPDVSGIVPADGPAAPEDSEWLPAGLDTGLLQYLGCVLDEPFLGLAPEEVSLLTQNLPVDELPREAVKVFGSLRRDYWQDLLLPVAADEEHDVTVYFVAVPGELSGLEPGASPGQSALNGCGVVLRYGNRASCFPLGWYTNAKFSSNPSLLVDDLDGDGLPEAALALASGDGTGCYVEDLYIFDLETMSYAIPDFSDVPLELFCDPGGTTARLASGDRERQVPLDELYVPFEGTAAVGNQVDFEIEDGRIVCRLDLDFTCNTLGYLAYAEFPVVYENGVYRLGPAVELGDLL